MTRMLRTDTPNSGFIFRARVHHHRRRPPPRVGGFSRLGPRVGDVLLSGSSSALSVRYSALHG